VRRPAGRPACGLLNCRRRVRQLGMTDDQAREALEDERRRLGSTLEAVRQEGALDDPGGASVEGPTLTGRHPADSGSETAARGTDLSLLEQVRSDLDDVDRALQKLDDGTYGRCEACGQPVDDERLAALPAARYCVAHQRAAEPGGAPGRCPDRGGA
jgi:DnaK suppressor protein